MVSNGKDVRGYPVRNGKLLKICERGHEIEKGDTQYNSSFSLADWVESLMGKREEEDGSFQKTSFI